MLALKESSTSSVMNQFYMRAYTISRPSSVMITGRSVSGIPALRLHLVPHKPHAHFFARRTGHVSASLNVALV